MKQKAFVPSEDKIYIVEAELCKQCNRVRLLYKGRCDCQDAKWLLLKDKVASNHDAMVLTLTTVDDCDIYRQGLVRGEIRAFENVLKMLEEK